MAIVIGQTGIMTREQAQAVTPDLSITGVHIIQRQLAQCEAELAKCLADTAQVNAMRVSEERRYAALLYVARHKWRRLASEIHRLVGQNRNTQRLIDECERDVDHFRRAVAQSWAERNIATESHLQG